MSVTADIRPAEPAVRWWQCRPVEVMARGARMGSIILDVRGRRPWLASRQLGPAAVTALRELARITGVAIYAYCVMPDHVHLVIGASARCDLRAFALRFKRRVERAAWAAGLRERLFEVSFRGHVVRHPTQLRFVMNEVLENPVRRGLVRDWKEYPYAGSLELEV